MFQRRVISGELLRRCTFVGAGRLDWIGADAGVRASQQAESQTRQQHHGAGADPGSHAASGVRTQEKNIIRQSNRSKIWEEIWGVRNGEFLTLYRSAGNPSWKWFSLCWWHLRLSRFYREPDGEGGHLFTLRVLLGIVCCLISFVIPQCPDGKQMEIIINGPKHVWIHGIGFIKMFINIIWLGVNGLFIKIKCIRHLLHIVSICGLRINYPWRSLNTSFQHCRHKHELMKLKQMIDSVCNEAPLLSILFSLDIKHITLQTQF